MTALLFSSLDEGDTPALSLSNRALSYGDGIFETVRVVDSSVPLLDYHRARFLRGVETLALGSALDMLQKFDQALEQAIQQLQLIEHSTSLLKIFAIRREGGRGYAPANPSLADIYVQAFELPHYQDGFYSEGIELRLCSYRMSEQPVLAGIKHLNRLDQVMAARELGDCPEGIVLDQHGFVVEGTKSNLIVFAGKSIFTPEIRACGVRGTLLSAMLAGEIDAIELCEKRLGIEDLHKADGLAMINSVFGVWPVKKFCEKEYAIPVACRELMVAVKTRFGFGYETA